MDILLGFLLVGLKSVKTNKPPYGAVFDETI
jgi:hypothetical protein